jgi:hypothetical protein
MIWLVLARAGFARRANAEPSIRRFDFMMFGLKDSQWPNKSPEPTAVGHRSSAIAVHAASRRWLSFLR